MLKGLRRSISPIFEREQSFMSNCIFSRQMRWYYNPNDGVLPRRESRRTLSRVRQDLSKGLEGKVVLLPPYVSPGEVRILLGVDYASAISLCGVKLYQQKYFWSDSDGRQFETSNKRQILVSFDQVAHSIKQFGLIPQMVNPEPEEFPLEYRSVGSVLLISYFSHTAPSKNYLHVSPSMSLSQQSRLLSHSDFVIVNNSCVSEYTFLNYTEKKFLIGDDSIPVPPIELSQQPRRIDPPPTSPNHHRTDILVDYETAPLCSGIVLDVEKTVQEGTVAVVLVKDGNLKIGQNYACGSKFGKVKNIWNRDEKLNFASPGMIVRVGIKSTVSPDDWFHVFPKQRAWRLAFYRQRIEELNGFQTMGVKLEGNFDQLWTDIVEENQVPDDTTTRLNQILSDDKSILIPPFEDEPVRMRYTRRQEMKLKNRILQEEKIQEEKSNLHIIRQIVHGKEDESVEKVVVNISRVATNVLLPKSQPVISILVKTRSISQFESVQDALEELEKEFEVKLPIVHGGIGPVTPTDLVHLQIEKDVCNLDTFIYSISSEGSSEKIIACTSIEDFLEQIIIRITRLKGKIDRDGYSKRIKLAIANRK